jgi:hypothetical protein
MNMKRNGWLIGAVYFAVAFAGDGGSAVAALLAAWCGWNARGVSNAT